MKKILFAGESWTSVTTHIKGFDIFTTSVYEEGIQYIREAMEQAGYQVTYLPNHVAMEGFPFSLEELREYSCIVLSDIGSNTLLLPGGTFARGEVRPNRLELIKQYVLEGGSLLMVGGYMSFTGIDCKARYGMTAIADVLPVKCLDVDDRVECCESVTPQTVGDHEALADVPKSWPHFLGYNKTIALPDSQVAATIGGDPLVVFSSHGKGRSCAFTSDCAPHWGPMEFVNWPGYNRLWKGILDYLTR